MARTKANATTRAFLSIEEVAALLGEHRSTCYRSIERGDFPVPGGDDQRSAPRAEAGAVERLIAGEPGCVQPARGQADVPGDGPLSRVRLGVLLLGEK